MALQTSFLFNVFYVILVILKIVLRPNVKHIRHLHIFKHYNVAQGQCSPVEKVEKLPPLIGSNAGETAGGVCSSPQPHYCSTKYQIDIQGHLRDKKSFKSKMSG